MDGEDYWVHWVRLRLRLKSETHWLGQKVTSRVATASKNMTERVKKELLARLLLVIAIRLVEELRDNFSQSNASHLRLQHITLVTDGSINHKCLILWSLCWLCDTLCCVNYPITPLFVQPLPRETVLWVTKDALPWRQEGWCTNHSKGLANKKHDSVKEALAYYLNLLDSHNS